MLTILIFIALLILSILLAYLGSKLMGYTDRTLLRSFFGLVLILAGIVVGWLYYSWLFDYSSTYVVSWLLAGTMMLHLFCFCRIAEDFDAKPDPDVAKI